MFAIWYSSVQVCAWKQLLVGNDHLLNVAFLKGFNTSVCRYTVVFVRQNRMQNLFRLKKAIRGWNWCKSEREQIERMRTVIIFWLQPDSCFSSAVSPISPSSHHRLPHLISVQHTDVYRSRCCFTARKDNGFFFLNKPKYKVQNRDERGGAGIMCLSHIMKASSEKQINLGFHLPCLLTLCLSIPLVLLLTSETACF